MLYSSWGDPISSLRFAITWSYLPKRVETCNFLAGSLQSLRKISGTFPHTSEVSMACQFVMSYQNTSVARDRRGTHTSSLPLRSSTFRLFSSIIKIQTTFFITLTQTWPSKKYLEECSRIRGVSEWCLCCWYCCKQNICIKIETLWIPPLLMPYHITYEPRGFSSS